MKEYTTPTVKVQLEGSEEILANAKRVILTAESGDGEIDKEWPDKGLTVDADTVSAMYTQDETVLLGSGWVRFEVTVVLPDGQVLKSETVEEKMHRAVREEMV